MCYDDNGVRTATTVSCTVIHYLYCTKERMLEVRIQLSWKYNTLKFLWLNWHFTSDCKSFAIFIPHTRRRNRAKSIYILNINKKTFSIAHHYENIHFSEIGYMKQCDPAANTIRFPNFENMYALREMNTETSWVFVE